MSDDDMHGISSGEDDAGIDLELGSVDGKLGSVNEGKRSTVDSSSDHEGKGKRRSSRGGENL